MRSFNQPTHRDLPNRPDRRVSTWPKNDDRKNTCIHAGYRQCINEKGRSAVLPRRSNITGRLRAREHADTHTLATCIVGIVFFERENVLQANLFRIFPPYSRPLSAPITIDSQSVFLFFFFIRIFPSNAQEGGTLCALVASPCSKCSTGP